MSASLSTHVLDTQGGRPAEGVPVRLYRGDELVSEGVTDGDGRIGALAADLAPGPYRLVFRPASPFFRRLEVELELGDGHFHVPLLLAPFSCTIYRGS
ncbi:MAG TPA: hydroxyisourate hydrolase [Gaiellaceae bacterium]|nr:hydroxyisourate hydrolase [Gaiellaceae bacterium]